MQSIDVNPLAILSEQLESLLRSTIAFLPQGIAAITLLLLTWGASRLAATLVSRILSRSRMRRSLVEVLRTLTAVLVWSAGILIAAVVAMPNLTPTKILAGLGIGSIAIGLAFKDIFENFLAGLMILLRDPMRLGDHIHCEGLEGKVEKITIRDTYLKRTDGQLVLVPNAMLFKNPVTIRTQTPLRRHAVVCGVAYDQDIGTARKVIMKAVESAERVSGEKPVQVFAREFNSSSVDFEIRWWSGSTPLEEHQSRDQVIEAVKKALDDAGIEIPFPYRTLTFKEAVRTLPGDVDTDSKT